MQSLRKHFLCCKVETKVISVLKPHVIIFIHEIVHSFYHFINHNNKKLVILNQRWLYTSCDFTKLCPDELEEVIFKHLIYAREQFWKYLV